MTVRFPHNGKIFRKFSTQWKARAPRTDCREASPQRDEGHPWPEAKMFPHCGKLSRRPSPNREPLTLF